MSQLPEDYFDDDEDFDVESDEWEFDCGADRYDGCGKAGSEECDFECPYRDQVFGKSRAKTGGTE